MSRSHLEIQILLDAGKVQEELYQKHGRMLRPNRLHLNPEAYFQLRNVASPSAIFQFDEMQTTWEGMIIVLNILPDGDIARWRVDYEQ